MVYLQENLNRLRHQLPSRTFTLSLNRACLTDTGEDAKLVHWRKRPKVDTLFSSLFSDASERRVWPIAESKILASTFGRFFIYFYISYNFYINFVVIGLMKCLTFRETSFIPPYLTKKVVNFSATKFSKVLSFKYYSDPGQSFLLDLRFLKK